MRSFLGATIALVAGLAIVATASRAEDVKSGKKGGAFDVTAITGESKDKTFCYVWKFNGEARAAVVVIFSNKADENIAKLVKAVDQVQKNNEKLGTVFVGISGVEAADLEKLQDTHKLITPLTIAKDKDGPKAWGINKEAAVTVVVYPRKGKAETFGFSDTKSAAGKAKEIAAAATKALE